MREKDDISLLQLYAREGDETAFRMLADRYANLVYAACLRDVRRQDLAEDAAQAVFLDLARKAKRIRVETTLVPWLLGAARLASRNVLRSERRRPTVPLDETVLAPDATSDQALFAALEALSAFEREAIVLRFIQGFSLAEVGRAQGISENTARMRVQRALKRLRTEYVPVVVAPLHLSKRLATFELPSPWWAKHSLYLATGAVTAVTVGVALGRTRPPNPTPGRPDSLDQTGAKKDSVPFPSSGAQAVPLHLKGDAVGKEYWGPMVFPVAFRNGEASFKIGERRYVARTTGARDRRKLIVESKGRAGTGQSLDLVPGKARNGAGEWFTTYFVEARIPTDGGISPLIGFRLYPKKAPTEPDRAGKLVVAPEYAYLGRVTLAGKSFEVGVSSIGSREDFICIDLNRDGRVGESEDEQYVTGEPFRVGGATYVSRFVFRKGKPCLEVAPLSAWNGVTRRKSARSPVSPGKPSTAPVMETAILSHPQPPAETARSQDGPSLPPLGIGTDAPDFTAYAPDGRPVSLASFRGKVVVLDFWASWCGPCEISMPKLARVYRKIKGQGTVVLSVNTWDKKPDFLRWVRKNGKKEYGFEFVRDPAEGDAEEIRRASIARRLYNVEAIPTMVVVDQRGKVAGTLTGSENEISLIKLLRRIGLRL